MANTFTGYYSTTTTYNPNDYTIYGGKLYKATNTNLGAAPIFNPGVWVVASNTFTYKSYWSANTSYNVGDTVRYANTSFVLVGNTSNNQIPGTIGSNWKVFNDNYKTIVTYEPGDIQYEGTILPQRLPIGNTYEVLSIINNNIAWADLTKLPSSSNVIANTIITNTLTSNGAAILSTVTTNTVTTNTLTTNTVTSNTVTSNNFTYSNGESVGFIYTLDDISSYFDGISTSFSLTYNGIPIAPNNPNQVQVEIGNISIYPNNRSTDYFNHVSEIYTQQNGFTLSGNVITFATAPMNGMGFYGTYKTSSDKLPPFYFYQLPFSPLNIMLN
jgi:hypothetical protein